MSVLKNIWAAAANKPQRAAASQPPNWQELSTEKKHLLYFQPAQNPKALLSIFCGFGTHPYQYAAQVRQANNSGFSVLIAGFPAAKTNFLDHYAQIIEGYYFNPLSPLYRAAQGLALIGVDHSASGMLFEQQYSQQGYRFPAGCGLSALYHINPFFDVTYASRFPLIDAFHNAQCARFPDHVPAATLIGRLYMAVLGNTDLFHGNEFYTPPTNGQAFALKKLGRECFKKIAARGNVNDKLNRVFIIGDGDPYACPKKGEDVARLLGADMMRCPGGHLIEQYPSLFQYVLNDINKKYALPIDCPDRGI